MNNIKTSAIITSGGNSTRFGSNKLLEIVKKTGFSVIETTILKFIDIVDEIIIPCQDEVKNFILNSKIYNEKIKFTSAGLTRQKSVYNGLLACSDPDIVLIHDGARPFISEDVIKKSIELAKENKATIVGLMAIDTIKQVINGNIIKTLDRKEIFQAHTPQVFDYQLIKNAHEKLKDYDIFTDDSSMVEELGIQPFALVGNKENIKITHKEDLK